MRQRRLKNEINVVPYIDVMLVLLVIFMVTAPMMTTANIDLPSVGQAAEPPAQPLEVTIHADESLSLRDLSRSDSAQGARVLSRADLTQAIIAAQAANPEQPVLIAGDKSIKYEIVLSIMDELQKQQVKRVGLLVQPNAR
ncbi:MAG: protein TolR [Pseudomonadota bacterium]